MRIGCASLPSGSEYCVPDSRHSSAMNTQTPQAELSFADAVHQFNTGDRDHCIAELLEPQHHSNALLDASMVLFNQFIEVLRRPQPRLRRQGTIGLQLAHRAVRRRVAIQCDRLWRTLLALERFAEERLGGSNVWRSA